MSDDIRSIVDAMFIRPRKGEARACVICGARTIDEFFGVPLCEPYDDNGIVVKRCKWIFRDGGK